jgi:hypothetical protein
MNFYRRIRRALEVHLENTPQIPYIFWENTSKENLIATAHVEPNFIPLRKRAVEIGPNPMERYDGIFQVIAYAPLNDGPAAVEDIAGLILDRYRPSGILIDTIGQDTAVVRIEYSEAGEAYEDRGCNALPLNIGWYSFRGNTT